MAKRKAKQKAELRLVLLAMLQGAEGGRFEEESKIGIFRYMGKESTSRFFEALQARYGIDCSCESKDKRAILITNMFDIVIPKSIDELVDVCYEYGFRA